LFTQHACFAFPVTIILLSVSLFRCLNDLHTLPCLSVSFFHCLSFFTQLFSVSLLISLILHPVSPSPCLPILLSQFLVFFV
jgi:hypothetical protein